MLKDAITPRRAPEICAPLVKHAHISSIHWSEHTCRRHDAIRRVYFVVVVRGQQVHVCQLWFGATRESVLFLSNCHLPLPAEETALQLDDIPLQIITALSTTQTNLSHQVEDQVEVEEWGRLRIILSLLSYYPPPPPPCPLNIDQSHHLSLLARVFVFNDLDHHRYLSR
jgi:hypothetical protein